MPWLQRGTVSLFYEEAPGGAPPLLLVHGWGCDHTFMAPQFAAFRGIHRVVAVDLRGHGRSDKPQQDYTIRMFAEDLSWVCQELTLERPVVVGHSMGGAVALELAAAGTQQVSGVALLDTAVLPTPDAWSSVQPVIAALKTSDYREAVAEFIADAFFLPSDDPRHKAWVIQATLTTPRHVLESAFEGIFAWDSAAAAGRCHVPTLYIASTRPRGDVTRLRQACPTLVHGQVVASGHFVQLEVPDQVNAMISRFLAVHLTRAPAGPGTTADLGRHDGGPE
jgi:pimeloyl-ACP methyl ester carboxylesterase